jgi:hypothetical protein
VLSDRFVLRARVAVLQIAAASFGRPSRAELLLSRFAVLLSRLAMLRWILLPNGSVLPGWGLLRRRGRLLRRQVMSTS